MIKIESEQKYSQSYDVVVIGAGNGGLAAATALALKGVRVILFEQHNLQCLYSSLTLFNIKFK